MAIPRPPAVSRRSCRQPVAAAGAAAGVPRSPRGQDRRRALRRNPGRSASATSSRMQEEVGPQGRDRRRIPPRLLLGPLRRAHRGLRDQARGVQVPRRSRPRGRRSPRPMRERELQRTQPLALDEFEFLRDVTQGDAEDHAAGAVDHAFLPLHRFRRARPPMRTSNRSSPISRRSSARRSPTWPRPAAAISSSTRSRSRCCAIRRSAQKVEARRRDAATGWSISISRRSTTPSRSCPADVVFGVHMCRGNFKGHYLAAGGYESVAERFFTRHQRQPFPARIRHRSAPATSRRCASCRKTRASCSGWSAARSRCSESIDALKRRTDEAARYIDLDRLAISPQCGFASTVAGNPVTEADERAKLAIVVNAAEIDLALRRVRSPLRVADEPSIAFPARTRARSLRRADRRGAGSASMHRPPCERCA